MRIIQRASLLLGICAFAVMVAGQADAQLNAPHTTTVYGTTPYQQSTSWWSSLFSSSKSLYPASSAPRIPAAGRAVSSTPHPAVARIIVPERKSAALGSGTLIAKTARHGYLITNWHVVRDASNGALVMFANGTQAQGRVLRTDKDWDLALIQIPAPAVEPLSISATVPVVGEKLWIAGYGSGEFLLQAGLCSQYLAPYPDWPMELVEVGAAARQGDSGGPILNARGELAGVLFGQGEGYTMGSYGGRVLQFLNQVPDVDSPTPATVAQLAAARQQPAAGLNIAAAPIIKPISNPIQVGSSLASMPTESTSDQLYWQPERRPIPPREPMPPVKTLSSDALIANNPTPPVANYAAMTPSDKPAPLAAYSMPQASPLVPKVASRVEPIPAAASPINNVTPPSGYGMRTDINPSPRVSIATVSGEDQHLTWEDFAGRTLVDQVITGLWVLGGVFLLIKICGWLTRSGSTVAHAKKSPVKRPNIKKPAPKFAPARVQRNDLYTDEDEDEDDEDDEDE